MKKNIYRFLGIFILLFGFIYQLGFIRFPVTCTKITEPFGVIPEQPDSQDQFLDWINQQYKWRRNEEVYITPNYDSPTHRIHWENDNKVYLANFNNKPLDLITLQIIFENSQQPQLSKAIECFGFPESYVATISEKHNVVLLWYQEKGMVVYGSADTGNEKIAKYDLNTILFLSKPTTTKAMLVIFEQLGLTDFSRDAQFMQTWRGMNEIDFVNSVP